MNKITYTEEKARAAKDALTTAMEIASETRKALSECSARSKDHSKLSYAMIDANAAVATAKAKFDVAYRAWTRALEGETEAIKLYAA